MDPTTKEYVYAKAHGMWASSFLVGRALELKAVKNIQEFYRVLFSEDPPLVPEAILTDLIEERLTNRTIQDYRKLLSMYEVSYPLLNLLLYEYELINLKIAISHLRDKKKDTSFIINIGIPSSLNWKAWPTLQDVTKNSIFSFFQDVPSIEKQVEKEMELDDAYCKAIWQSLFSLPLRNRQACEKLVIKEFLLRNIVWVLRLRTYYDYRGTQLKKQLLGNWDEMSKRKLIEPISFALEASLSDRDAWNGWRYEWLINNIEENEVWKVDPRYAQAISDRYLFNLALHSFHNDDDPISLLFSFFKLKRGEEYFIRQMLENLKVGKSMPFEEVIEGLF